MQTKRRLLVLLVDFYSTYGTHSPSKYANALAFQ
jgi:hypothetical protein